MRLRDPRPARAAVAEHIPQALRTGSGIGSSCDDESSAHRMQCAALMELPKTILVPTDFSEYAQEALDYAVKLAQRLDASVCIVHAYMMPVTGWEGAWTFPEELIAQLEAAARSKLDATLKRAREGLPASATFLHGDPREIVPQLAAHLKTDLIVMGTRGRKGLSRAIMGSVTETVMRNAPCAVLAVRHPRDVAA